MKCKCCKKTGDWTIVGRNGRGRVCEECYEFLAAPLYEIDTTDEEKIREGTKKMARAVIRSAISDLLYYRRHKSGHKVTWRRERDIIEAGIEAETFFGDLYGDFTHWCSLAELPPARAKRRINNLTIEDVHRLLKEKSYNNVKQRKKITATK